MKQTERIRRMEEKLTASASAVAALSEALDRYAAVEKSLRVLERYYESPRWQRDLAADEAGRLPRDLARGVLSEDAVYDLLVEEDELKKRLKQMAANGTRTFSRTLASLPKTAFRDETVFFRPLRDEEDLVWAVLECRLSPEQRELVNPAGFSVGRAYLHPDDHFPCVICAADGRRIGFIDLYVSLTGDGSVGWSFFIDESEQGAGLGRAAAALAVRILRTAFSSRPIRLSSEAGNEKAHRLYRSLGFCLLDERDGDDLVFEYRG